jgi:hypothetical protein
MAACLEHVRTALPGVRLEVRLDSAFFSEATLALLEHAHIEYTLSSVRLSPARA